MENVVVIISWYNIHVIAFYSNTISLTKSNLNLNSVEQRQVSQVALKHT